MGALIQWIIDLINQLGGPAVGFAILLENFVPPIPSEVVLPLAGVAASHGELGVLEAIIWATGGSVTGALALYALGALLGRDRTRTLLDKLPLVNLKDVTRAEQWFERHGSKAILIGRVIPGVRSVISIPAGVNRMPLVKFVLLTMAGSAVWNSLFVVAGFELGDNWHVVEQYTGIIQKVVIAALVGLVIWWIIKRVRARKAGEEPDDD
ncbi:DedA family protein [Propionibacteriaceae bacterium Y1685]|uniref:DedA family protein n=1 Tax=Microlunatus sp. Y1700 TaxID=3418487 RepID=UPI003B78A756